MQIPIIELMYYTRWWTESEGKVLPLPAPARDPSKPSSADHILIPVPKDPDLVVNMTSPSYCVPERKPSALSNGIAVSYSIRDPFQSQPSTEAAFSSFLQEELEPHLINNISNIPIYSAQGQFESLEDVLTPLNFSYSTPYNKLDLTKTDEHNASCTSHTFSNVSPLSTVSSSDNEIFMSKSRAHDPVSAPPAFASVSPASPYNTPSLPKALSIPPEETAIFVSSSQPRCRLDICWFDHLESDKN